jgi:hypothetical protein
MPSVPRYICSVSGSPRVYVKVDNVFLRFRSFKYRIQVTFFRALAKVELYFAVCINCVSIYVVGVAEWFRPELTVGRDRGRNRRWKQKNENLDW